MKENESITKCRVVESLLGLMEECLKGNTLMTKKKDTESFIGPAEKSIAANEKMENNTGLEKLLIKMGRFGKDGGSLARKLKNKINKFFRFLCLKL